MGKLRGYGNAIDWRPAAAFIAAASEAMSLTNFPNQSLNPQEKA